MWSWKQLTSLPFSPVDRFSAGLRSKMRPAAQRAFPLFHPGFHPTTKVAHLRCECRWRASSQMCAFGNKTNYLDTWSYIIYIYAIFKKNSGNNKHIWNHQTSCNINIWVHQSHALLVSVDLITQVDHHGLLENPPFTDDFPIKNMETTRNTQVPMVKIMENLSWNPGKSPFIGHVWFPKGKMIGSN